MQITLTSNPSPALGRGESMILCCISLPGSEEEGVPCSGAL